jgi:glycosyltransferase involved in cell wall biosynthesis
VVSPAASIVISTKNRKDELREALRSAFAQTAPVEVVVIDDGSTDGTAELVRQEFPEARLTREERSRGYIVQRNQGARLARAPVIISIDDDAAFPSRDTVAQTLAELDHPRVGAVAIPFIDVKKGPDVRQRAPGDGLYVAASYIGTAHALRRDVFLSLGGYRPVLVHQGEEADLCIRMLEAGYVVRLGRADPIHHFESPRRDFSRMDLYGRRNDVLFAWFNVPWPDLPMHLAGTTVNGALWGLRVRRPLRMLRGLAQGFGAMPGTAAERRPVPREVYRLARELKRAGAVPLADIEARLPPLRLASSAEAA